MNSNGQAFGAALRKIRLAHGLSQRQLAMRYGRLQGREDGVAQGVIASWEAGNRFPSADTVEILALALVATETERDELMMSAGHVPPSLQGNNVDVIQAIDIALRVSDNISDEAKRQIAEFTRRIADANHNRKPLPDSAAE